MTRVYVVAIVVAVVLVVVFIGHVTRVHCARPEFYGRCVATTSP